MGRIYYLLKEDGMSVKCLSGNLIYSDSWDTEVHLGGLHKKN